MRKVLIKSKKPINASRLVYLHDEYNSIEELIQNEPCLIIFTNKKEPIIENVYRVGLYPMFEKNDLIYFQTYLISEANNNLILSIDLYNVHSRFNFHNSIDEGVSFLTELLKEPKMLITHEPILRIAKSTLKKCRKNYYKELEETLRKKPLEKLLKNPFLSYDAFYKLK